MGRTLADEIADDVDRLLLDTDDFAENVIHHPVDGEDVPLAAIVHEELPANAMDGDQGIEQVFVAQILISSRYDDAVTVGRGTEVSKFTVRGNRWRAVGKATGRGSLVVKLERRVAKTVKKGWRSGTP